MTTCLAGKACLCRFERGGSVAGRRDRFAWDCGALRPGCGAAPAELPPSSGNEGLSVFPQVTLPAPGMEGAGTGGMGRRQWR
ncbi:hypothetical protein VQH23_11180 [Pararoseomonas sp. SCSIO 73927]|uniref:hypothetical protein n=1 Tax=Pararoseomonas sp. SCSIO 73927 TaxID=3114537 RepID=UPI0030CD043D